MEQKIRDKNLNARSEEAAWKRNPRVNPKGSAQETSKKPTKSGDCNQWTSNGQCSRGDSCSSKHDVNKKGKKGQEEDPVLDPDREDTRKERYQREKTQRYQFVRKPTQPGMLPIFRRNNARKNPHAAKKISSQHDLFKRRSDGHQRRNDSECDIFGMRKATSVQEKEKDLHWILFRGEERTIAVRTLLFKKNLLLQHGRYTNMFRNIRGTYQVNKYTFFETKTDTRAILRTLYPAQENQS